MNKLRVKLVAAEDALKNVSSAIRAGISISSAKGGNAAIGKTLQVTAFTPLSKLKFESSLINA